MLCRRESGIAGDGSADEFHSGGEHCDLGVPFETGQLCVDLGPEGATRRQDLGQELVPEVEGQGDGGLGIRRHGHPQQAVVRGFAADPADIGRRQGREVGDRAQRLPGHVGDGPGLFQSQQLFAHGPSQTGSQVEDRGGGAETPLGAQRDLTASQPPQPFPLGRVGEPHKGNPVALSQQRDVRVRCRGALREDARHGRQFGGHAVGQQDVGRPEPA